MAVIVDLVKNGVSKKGFVGFSWTVLFFGVFVPLIRGDLKWAIIMFITSFLTFGLAWIIFPFIYNKIYTKELLEKGYSPYGERSEKILRSSRLYIK